MDGKGTLSQTLQGGRAHRHDEPGIEDVDFAEEPSPAHGDLPGIGAFVEAWRKFEVLDRVCHVNSRAIDGGLGQRPADWHREAITSRPLLLHAIVTRSRHARQTTLTIASSHAKSAQRPPLAPTPTPRPKLTQPRVATRESQPRGTRAIEIDHGAAHPQQRASVRQILQPGDRRLRTQVAIRGRQNERHLEHRIAAKTGSVVAVFVAGRDHQLPKANDVGQAVGSAGPAPEDRPCRRRVVGDAKAPLDLAHRQNPAVRRQQATIEFGHDRLAARR